MHPLRSLAAIAVVLLGGCAALGGVDDGTSVARGVCTDGFLVNGVKLPPKGDGYVMPPLWQKRGNVYGTEELVGLIVRVGRRMSERYPGAAFAVGDLADDRGGRTPWHKSHQNGLDVDLVFYARDAQGAPLPLSPRMVRFGADGLSLGGGTLQFDVERNWALLRELLDDPGVEIQHVFIFAPLRQLLLDHARQAGEAKELIDRAAELMSQPAGVLPHDDHFHVRIYCPVSDRSLGCADRRPLRWLKKSFKYVEARRLWSLLPPDAKLQAVVRVCYLLAPGWIARL